MSRPGQVPRWAPRGGRAGEVPRGHGRRAPAMAQTRTVKGTRGGGRAKKRRGEGGPRTHVAPGEVKLTRKTAELDCARLKDVQLTFPAHGVAGASDLLR